VYQNSLILLVRACSVAYRSVVSATRCAFRTTGIGTTTCLILASAVAGWATTFAQSQQPSFRAQTELVEVDVVATDRAGHVVQGLNREDFDIFEDGTKVPIATFVVVNSDAGSGDGADASRGRFLVLVLDNARADPESLTRMRAIANALVERMSIRDVIGILPVDNINGSTTSDKQVALDAIQSMKPAGRPMDGRRLGAVMGVIQQMDGVKHQHKSVVYIGDSSAFLATESVLPKMIPLYSQTWKDMLHVAEQSNVSLYAIDPIGLTDARAVAFDGVRTFAAATGGEAFVNSNLFDRATDQIWAEAGNYYLLGYEPPRGKAKTHTIAVRTKRDDVIVRARKTR